MAASDHLNPHQSQLFDTTPYDKPAPKMDYDPVAWITGPDISFHASKRQSLPAEGGGNYGIGFHHGDISAAMVRGHVTSPSHISSEDLHSHLRREYVHPVRMEGPTALRSEPTTPTPPDPAELGENPEEFLTNKAYYESQQKRPLAFEDYEANSKMMGNDLVEAGENVPYINAAESVGSMSFRSPRSNIHTWAEDVQSDPGASRFHQILAEQFDLTIPSEENWIGVLRGPKERMVKTPSGRAIDMGAPVNARDLPYSLSGEVTEQPSLFGDSPRLSGSSKLSVLQPRMKKKVDPNDPSPPYAVH